MGRRGRPPYPDILTPREWEVLELLREGLSNEEIAERLGVSLAGAKYHVSEILGKLGVETRHEAAAWVRPERPWWAGAIAPLGFLRRLGWAPSAISAGVLIAALAGLALLIWSLASASDDGGDPGETLAEAGLSHLTFASGEVVAADGPGVFFVDPETGVTEGWVVSGGEQSEFTPTGRSADGRLVLYTCREQQPEGARVPCDEAPEPGVWYLVDTAKGRRTTLPEGVRYLSLSPDGGTLLGETVGGLRLFDVESAESGRSIDVAAASASIGARWSPDGTSILFATAVATYLVDTGDGSAAELLPVMPEGVGWAPDSSKVALVLPLDSKTPDRPGGTLVFDAEGRQLWQAAVTGFTPNPRWSPDSERLVIEATAAYGPDPAEDFLRRADVFAGATGEPLYRIEGAIVCGGPVWTADGSGLVISSYGLGAFVADPVAGSFLTLDVGAAPSPVDAELGIGKNGPDFFAVDLATGAATLLADTELEPAWDALHEPLFAGGRIVFTEPHGGHGGCSVGPSPTTPPELAFRYPPFVD